MQLNIFDDIEVKKPFEVLRIEIRLNTKWKIKQVLNSINIKTDLTFKNLFNHNISREIVKYFWQKIEIKISVKKNIPVNRNQQGLQKKGLKNTLS